MLNTILEINGTQTSVVDTDVWPRRVLIADHSDPDQPRLRLHDAAKPGGHKVAMLEEIPAAVTGAAEVDATPSAIPLSRPTGRIDPKYLSEMERQLWAVFAEVKATNGSINLIGDSNGEGFGLPDPSEQSWFALFRKAIFGSTAEATNDAETLINFAGVDLYGVSYAGDWAIGATGPVKKSIGLYPGGSIRFTGAYAYTDVCFNAGPGAGTLEFRRGSTLYHTHVCAGAEERDVEMFPLGATGSSAVEDYEIRAVGGPVEITCLKRLTTGANRMHIQRMAMSGYSTANFTDAQTLASMTKQGGFYQNAVSAYFIALGTNDTFSNQPGVARTPAQYGDNLRTICKAIRAANPKNIIILVDVAVPTASWPAQLADVSLYNAMARTVCAEFTAVLVPFSSVNFINGGYNDGLHYSPTGHLWGYEQVVKSVVDSMGSRAYQSSAVTEISTKDWQPTLGTTGAPFTSITYGARQGLRFRAGNQVILTFDMEFTTTGGDGDLTITGMEDYPVAGNTGSGAISIFNGITLSTSRTHLGVLMSGSGALMYPFQSGSGATGAQLGVPAGNLSSSGGRLCGMVVFKA